MRREYRLRRDAWWFHLLKYDKLNKLRIILADRHTEAQNKKERSIVNASTLAI